MIKTPNINLLVRTSKPDNLKNEISQFFVIVGEMTERRKENFALLASYLRSFIDDQGNLTVIPSQLDRKVHYKIFELCVALKHNLTLWERLPPDFLCDRDLPRYRNSGLYPDMGVDCVGYTGHDVEIAAQAKWYGEKSYVNFTNIATFNTIAEYHLNAKQKLLVLSEHGKLPSYYNRERYGFMEDRVTEVEIDQYCLYALYYYGINGQVTQQDEMTNDQPIETCEAILTSDAGPRDENIVPISVEKKLWSHQEDAVRIALNKLKEKNRAFICMPCGTGKSAVLVTVCQEYLSDTGGCAGVLVPTVLLQEQILEAFAKWTPELKVAKVSDNNIDADVFVCLNASTHKLPSNLSILLVDEAHHMDTELLNEDNDDEENLCKTERVWATQARNLDAGKIVLFTATPSNSDSVDYRMTLPEAINKSLLVDYCLNVPIFSGIGDRKYAIANLIAERSEWTRILAYCNTLAEAEIFCGICNSKGIPSCVLSGKQKLCERKMLLEYFKRGWFRVIVSVRVLSEGIDIPCIDTVVFVEPRGGKFDVVQCVGRALRKCDERGKKLATIVLPCTDEKKELRKFLKCLNSSDDRIIGALREKKAGRVGFSLIGECNITENAELLCVEEYTRLELEIRDNSGWMMKLVLLKEFLNREGRYPSHHSANSSEKILGSWLQLQRNRKRGTSRTSRNLSANEIFLLEELPDWFWEKEDPWMGTYLKVTNFVKEQNRFPSHHSTESFERTLGRWVQLQRMRKKGKTHTSKDLLQHEILLLEELPNWFWEKENPWNGHYDDLVEYLRRNKNQYPNSKSKDKVIATLGTWVVNQRRKMKRTTKKSLEDWQIVKLELLPDWRWVW